MMKRLAIIPARGGSKRIQNKNIKLFCDKPMISYVLDTIKNSNLFEKIHVSTDSYDIAQIVTGLKYKIDFMRPATLADDFTPIIPVLRYVVDEFERMKMTYDEVWTFMPCSPFLTTFDLIDASRIFNITAEKPLISVCEYNAPIEWAFKKLESNIMIPINPSKLSLRSQDLDKHYYDSGNFIAYSNKMIKELSANSIEKGFLSYVLPKYRAIDIDDEDDWVKAEFLFRANKDNLGR